MTTKTVPTKVAAIVGVALLAGAVMSAVPFSVVAQDGDGVETPTPSGPASDPYDCDDFETVEQLRAYYDPDNDISDLDDDPGEEPEDPDRIACEDRFPNQEPYDTPTATATPTEEAPPEEETDTPTATEEPEQTETPTEEEPTETPEETETPTETSEEETPADTADAADGEDKTETPC